MKRKCIPLWLRVALLYGSMLSVMGYLPKRTGFDSPETQFLHIVHTLHLDDIPRCHKQFETETSHVVKFLCLQAFMSRTEVDEEMSSTINFLIAYYRRFEPTRMASNHACEVSAKNLQKHVMFVNNNDDEFGLQFPDPNPKNNNDDKFGLQSTDTLRAECAFNKGIPSIMNLHCVGEKYYPPTSDIQCLCTPPFRFVQRINEAIHAFDARLPRCDSKSYYSGRVQGFKPTSIADHQLIELIYKDETDGGVGNESKCQISCDVGYQAVLFQNVDEEWKTTNTFIKPGSSLVCGEGDVWKLVDDYNFPSSPILLRANDEKNVKNIFCVKSAPVASESAVNASSKQQSPIIIEQYKVEAVDDAYCEEIVIEKHQGNLRCIHDEGHHLHHNKLKVGMRCELKCANPDLEVLMRGSTIISEIVKVECTKDGNLEPPPTVFSCGNRDELGLSAKALWHSIPMADETFQTDKKKGKSLRKASRLCLAVDLETSDTCTDDLRVDIVMIPCRHAGNSLIWLYESETQQLISRKCKDQCLTINMSDPHSEELTMEPCASPPLNKDEESAFIYQQFRFEPCTSTLESAIFRNCVTVNDKIKDSSPNMRTSVAACKPRKNNFRQQFSWPWIDTETVKQEPEVPALIQGRAHGLIPWTADNPLAEQAYLCFYWSRVETETPQVLITKESEITVATDANNFMWLAHSTECETPLGGEKTFVPVVNDDKEEDTENSSKVENEQEQNNDEEQDQGELERALELPVAPLPDSKLAGHYWTYSDEYMTINPAFEFNDQKEYPWGDNPPICLTAAVPETVKQEKDASHYVILATCLNEGPGGTDNPDDMGIIDSQKWFYDECVKSIRNVFTDMCIDLGNSAVNFQASIQHANPLVLQKCGNASSERMVDLASYPLSSNAEKAPKLEKQQVAWPWRKGHGASCHTMHSDLKPTVHDSIPPGAYPWVGFNPDEDNE
eukprot:GHVL01044355.1.p1 GENE.GHVL01044355.1~~GHVL01044355.1.p1  ORF type:complete len:955 (+),score=155.70 GHVL01044355.1:162-3026(+)